MTVSPEITTAVEHCIRDAGYKIGTTTLVNPRTGETRRVVNGVDAKTGESWTVQAASRYEAVVELVQQAGFDLEE